MPRRTRRRSFIQDGGDLDDGMEIIADGDEELPDDIIEPSSNTADGGFSALAEEQQDELVKRMIRYMICRNAKKRPVKRQDLSRHIFNGMMNIRSKPSVFNGTFQQAQQIFRHVFGLEIKEIKKQVKQKTRTAGRTQTQSQSLEDPSRAVKGYILVSVLPKEARTMDKRRLPELGFLTTIAAMIVLSPGCRIEQESLYRVLERIGVKVIEKNGHQQLNHGNVKELLEIDLVNQWYLEREKEDTTFYYTLGPRLRAEIEDDDLLMFIAAVFKLGGAEETDLDEMSKKELQMRLDEAWGVEREEKVASRQ